MGSTRPDSLASGNTVHAMSCHASLHNHREGHKETSVELLCGAIEAKGIKGGMLKVNEGAFKSSTFIFLIINSSETPLSFRLPI